MGFFRRNRGHTGSPTEPGPQVAEAVIFDDADCTELVHVVGESHYQDALRSICGSHQWEDVSYDCLAALVPEPSNPYDRNAVMVQINAFCVGHLSHSDAVRYRRLIDEAAAKQKYVACRARIAGHGPGGETSNLGVFLKLPRADESIEWSSHDYTPKEEPTRTGEHRRHDGAGGSNVGLIRGKHYSYYVDEIKTLKRHGNDVGAEELLLECVEATEREEQAHGLGVAPWYYEQLAIIYRRRHEPDQEISILERFAGHSHAPGKEPPRLLERLSKAQAKRRAQVAQTSVAR